MLSTTDRRSSAAVTRSDGQVLVIFALSLFTLLLFAALAFDTGMMLLQRRDQQDAADAAALAGAFYLPGSAGQARTAATTISTANGYTTGGTVGVTVNIPPTSGDHAGQSGAIEVVIADHRPSIFGGLMGVFGWDIGARAVAVNQNGVAAGFSMLSLDPTGCDAIQVNGKGNVTANGNIQVNSTCAGEALLRSGSGTLTVDASSACNVVGGIKDKGAGSLNCTQNTPAPAVPDPLSGLAAPAKPAFPTPPTYVSGSKSTIPGGCPGGATAATEAAPAVCQFTSSYAGTTWRLHPGYYPGGIQLQAGTFYWEPGIYWIGGGGVTINGTGTVSTSVLAPTGTTLDFGILFYNTEDPAFHAQCATSPVTAPNPAVDCVQQIQLNGAQATINFYPLMNGSIFDGLIVYQDRNLDVGGPGVDDVVINGGTSTMNVRGTIYVPKGEVKVNGGTGTMVTDQVIAFRYTINGNGGTIQLLNNQDFEFKFQAAGLVE